MNHLTASIVRGLRFLRTRNTHILGDTGRPAEDGAVNLEYWRPDANAHNLGDALSPVIVDWMLRRSGFERSCSATGKTVFLSAVGSILQIGCNSSTVWGTGLLRDDPAYWYLRPAFRRLDICAIRGPRTREALLRRGFSCLPVYGDPAVLMPLMYQPEVSNARSDYLVCRHFRSKDGTDIDLNTNDYRAVVDAIVSTKLLVSESLHGIILAEAYRVPVILLQSSGPDFSLFKFQDWYESTGRKDFPVARSVEEALHLEPPSLPDLGPMQQRLMDVFPYYLWEEDGA